MGRYTIGMGTYIFLDPDGSRGVGLTVVVAAPTGVTYAHQCAGHATDVRELEGFAVPLSGTEAAAPLLAFFRRFRGNPPDICGETWSDSQIEQLSDIVAVIPFWQTSRADHDDSREFLALDETRLDSLTEAWIPVQTAYGPGVLLCDNSD